MEAINPESWELWHSISGASKKKNGQKSLDRDQASHGVMCLSSIPIPFSLVSFPSVYICKRLKQNPSPWLNSSLFFCFVSFNYPCKQNKTQIPSLSLLSAWSFYRVKRERVVEWLYIIFFFLSLFGIVVFDRIWRKG